MLHTCRNDAHQLLYTARNAYKTYTLQTQPKWYHTYLKYGSTACSNYVVVNYALMHIVISLGNPEQTG